ncbi:hypothetical protein WJX73_002421 [Symbiochloris irregularis]|uniref:Uncharacterized protein n=1 Tax=Symbiochloris irregularis TaxID=706552 RepID=A0AAW1NLV2_9CHLO
MSQDRSHLQQQQLLDLMAAVQARIAANDPFAALTVLIEALRVAGGEAVAQTAFSRVQDALKTCRAASLVIWDEVTSQQRQLLTAPALYVTDVVDRGQEELECPDWDMG